MQQTPIDNSDPADTASTGLTTPDLHSIYMRIFDSNMIGIVVSDARGGVLKANDYFLQLIGITPEELATGGIRWVDITPPEHLALDFQALAEARQRGVCTPYEKEYRLRNGSRVPVLIGLAALPGVQEQFAGFVLDLTARKQAEQALHDSEEQLLQAQKMEAIGLLAGGIAHDFRNQLTVIKGYSEMLLRRRMLSGTAREYVEEILKAANRAASLTGELLAFGRKEILRPEVVNLNNVLQEIAKTIRSMLGEDICLSIMPALDLHSVRIDPGQFQQALVNLAMNARDAMPQGGQLTVETANVEPDPAFQQQHPDAAGGPHVVVTVRDSGEGMDKDTLARVFEPFFTTKPHGRGTGLGLSMVYGFVRQSGGHIDVVSRPGQGSTFRLYFPCEARASQVASSKTESFGLVHGTGTILLAEDDQAIRRLMSQTLQECGYTVLEAADAPQALHLVEGHASPIDLLVTDVVMPGMNGYELAGKLRHRHPDMEVLYVSGYAGDALEQRGIVEQHANLLVKPFNTQQIAATVRRILGRGNPS